MVAITPHNEEGSVPTGANSQDGKAPPSPQHVDLALPSNFVFYDFDRLYCRTLSISELNMMHVTKETGSMRHLVHAISRCLNVDARALTVGDFYFVLYWERLNSFGTIPYTMTWTCPNPRHNEEAEENLDLYPGNDPANVAERERILKARDTLSNKSNITKAHLKEKHPNFEEVVKLMADVKEKFGVLLAVQLMDDVLSETEIVEQTVKAYKQKVKALEGEKGKKKVNKEDIDRLIEDSMNDLALASVDQAYIQDLASHIHRQHGQSLADRIAYLNTRTDLGPDFHAAIEEFKELTAHGVVEEVEFSCRGCGHHVKQPLDIDVLDFFPNHPTRRYRK